MGKDQVSYLTTLVQYAGTSTFIEEYIDLVKDKSILRRMISISQDIERCALNNPEDVQVLLDEAQSKFSSIGMACSQKTKRLDLKFVNELSPTYFKEKPPEKPVLLEWDSGIGHNKKMIPFLHKEITGMLVAEGGVGKTHLCSNLATCVTSGVPFLGKFEIKQPGAVCLILGENNLGDIRRLLWKTRTQIAEWLKGNRDKEEHEKFSTFPDALERIDRLLCPVSVHGLNASLVDEMGGRTSFYYSLLNQLKLKEPTEGWQLIILDPASRFAGAGAEKDNSVATAFVACLENFSEELRGLVVSVLNS